MTKKSIMLLIKILGSAAVIYLLSKKVNIYDIYIVLKRITLPYLLVSMASVVIAQIFFAKRWQQIIAINGPLLPLNQLFQQVYIGFFISQGMPSVVGGDVFRVMMLKEYGISLVRAIQTLFIDRICGMMSLTLLSLVFLPFEFSTFLHSDFGWLILLVFFTLLCAFFVAFIFHRFPIFIFEFLKHIQDLSKTFADFIKHKNFVITLLFSTVGTCSILMSMYFLSLDLHLNLNISAIMSSAAVIFLIAALPISFAGWGLREGAMVVILNAFHVPANEALSLSLLVGAVQLIASIPGLIMWFLYKHHHPKLEIST